MALLARTTRSGAVENEHYGHVAIADAEGRLLGWAGDPHTRFYLRSSAKPLQALSVVASGAYEAFGMTPAELAVCCASHSGSREHRETVAGLLAKAGLGEEHLQCGTHLPGDPEARRELEATGRPPTPLHNNCSGKHAGMLVTTKHTGAPLGTYLSLDHPVQQTILRNLSALSGVPLEDFHIGVDGCGAPVHRLPLSAMATAFARAASGKHAPEELQPAALAIREATAAYPHLVSSRGDFSARLIGALRGDTIAKGGAEALFCAGFASLGVGFAVKIGDGSFRAMSPIVLRILELIGVKASVRRALAEFERLPVTNCHGDQVGWVEAEGFRL